MRKCKLLILLVAICNFAQAQNSDHIISGLDLNKDWYTLTNQAALAYFIQETDRKENNEWGIPVDVDQDYLNNNVEPEFLNIGFTELILVFPGGSTASKSELEKLAPNALMAHLKYSSDGAYESLNKKDFSRIASILMYQFGPPDNTMKKEWGASFEWKFENAQIGLTSNKSDHIVLFYLKQE